MAAWDESKRLNNLANHGVDFRDLTRLDWNSAVVFEDRRKNYGETRFIAMAKLGARLHVVLVVRSGDRRYISARRANSREVAKYERQTRTS